MEELRAEVHQAEVHQVEVHQVAVRQEEIQEPQREERVEDSPHQLLLVLIGKVI